jgi:hypothetical protein
MVNTTENIFRVQQFKTLCQSLPKHQSCSVTEWSLIGCSPGLINKLKTGVMGKGETQSTIIEPAAGQKPSAD